MLELTYQIERRLSDVNRCAFLAGAGISMPPPSSLPSAVSFIEEVVNIIDPDNTYGDLIRKHLFVDNNNIETELDLLRFETVMASIGMSIDNDLKIMQLFSKCTVPNDYHYYLAKQLAIGAIVMTTNFDNLIEIACRELSIPYDLIIDEEDIISFSLDTSKFQFPLIKLHGGYDALSYDGNVRRGPANLQATLEQVSMNFPGFKRTGLFRLLKSVFNECHVCILGYSGCDDFDIMPMVQNVNIEHGLTWLNYSQKSPEIEASSDKRLSSVEQPAKYSPPHLLLQHLREIKDESDMMIIKGDPAAILGVDARVGNESKYQWAPVFKEWQQQLLSTQTHKKLLLSIILSILCKYKDSIKVMESIDHNLLDSHKQNIRHFFLANDYYHTNDYGNTINYLTKVIARDSDVSAAQKGYAYYTLARINKDKGALEIASVFLQSAMEFFQKDNDLARIIDCFHESGRIQYSSRNYEKAIDKFEKSAEICEKVGDLGGAGMSFGEIANAYREMNRIDLSEQYLEKAIKYHKLTSNKEGLIIAFHAKGINNFYKKDYEAAEEFYNKALVLEKEINSKLHLGHTLHCLGDLMVSKGEIQKAKHYLRESLKVKNEIGDQEGIKNSSLALQMLERLESLQAMIK